MRSLEVEVRWARVESKSGILWTFPSRISDYMRRHCSRPAVYRWCIGPSIQAEPELIYIGETNSLTQRISGVLSPSRGSKPKGTNQRLNALFKEEQSHGSVVTLETISFEDFSFNGVVYSTADMSLWHKFKRCALENLLLCSYLRWEDRLLNLRVAPYKRIEKGLIDRGINVGIVRNMDVKKTLQDLE